jgi:serine protease
MRESYFDPPPGFEFKSYGVPMTQSDSTNIPSSKAEGDCMDPNSFKVAVIDSGYMFYHPDSPCVITDVKSNCRGLSLAYDPEGQVEPWWAPVKAIHGTHVMGIIGSLGGSGQYSNVGVVPTRNNICYLTYRVFPESGAGAYTSTILAAVESAVYNGAKVINMSLGGGAPISIGQQLYDKVAEAGTLTVAAAGNSGKFENFYPGSYNNVISVGAIGNTK